MGRCHLIGHLPGDHPVWNAGWYFTRCSRCGRDMMRGDGPWRSVPRSYRVVWEGGVRRHALPSDWSGPTALPNDDHHLRHSHRPRGGPGWVMVPPDAPKDENASERDVMEQAIAAFRFLVLR